jgi:hypothetical protein
MNNAIRGALLSGLVFPGLGQLVLRRYRRGAVIMLAVMISLFLVIGQALQYARDILEKIELHGDIIDITAITDAATREVARSGGGMLNLYMMFIVFCWVAGTVDAYRIGKGKDRERRPPGQVPRDNPPDQKGTRTSHD